MFVIYGLAIIQHYIHVGTIYIDKLPYTGVMVGYSGERQLIEKWSV